MCKHIFRAPFLIAVLATCVYFIAFGQRGITRYYRITQEINHAKIKLFKLEQQTEDLKNKIARWSNDEFEIEKFARQNLQMSRPDEIIFALN